MKAAVLALGMLAAGCVNATPTTPSRVPVAPPRYPVAGLESVIGQNSAGLARLFGGADRDMREGTARKLQFASPFCVLDAYLYPKTAGADPVVTHIDARQPDGRDIDRASCVAAMQRRSGDR